MLRIRTYKKVVGNLHMNACGDNKLELVLHDVYDRDLNMSLSAEKNENRFSIDEICVRFCKD